MTLTVDNTRTWVGPTAPERLALLREATSIAIVGASENQARASFFVATYLLSSSPYDVYFINPRAKEILGRPVYASLADLPVVPDVVDVFRRHEDLPSVLDEVLALRESKGGGKAPNVLWLQLGSWHEEVARRAEEAGLSVVMDRCVKIEHARFHGGLHLAGFDTGVISSRRQIRA
ncbi:CoA-binding protein [Streptomyces sp. NP160]|uniref:CoA-binding protein n=1 Tax=Streptomyces sp. NP160 TaxID=2586637 RepID=UPI00111A1791|nr:CoA-binding protein [Streptomyces sp. NP160]TNM67668.1 CoA-binding protein [Streptomyces sp. NP160]